MDVGFETKFFWLYIGRNFLCIWANKYFNQEFAIRSVVYKLLLLSSSEAHQQAPGDTSGWTVLSCYKSSERLQLFVYVSSTIRSKRRTVNLLRPLCFHVTHLLLSLFVTKQLHSKQLLPATLWQFELPKIISIRLCNTELRVCVVVTVPLDTGEVISLITCVL
jgi:hypothetical protein